jgi:hypothetical protein
MVIRLPTVVKLLNAEAARLQLQAQLNGFDYNINEMPISTITG